MNEDNIILGIDPGTTIMGFGIIKATSKEMSLIQMNELQLKKYENHFLKLQKIFERTQEIIDEFHPDEIAIEAPFFSKRYPHAPPGCLNFVEDSLIFPLSSLFISLNSTIFKCFNW